MEIDLMDDNNMIKIEEVARRVDVSVQTINTWYRFAKQKPENKLASLLPPFYQEKARGIRYWREGDIDAIKQFKYSIPKGRNGILGCITQKSVRAKKTEKR
jgi:DNA-binding transcriptional MerR regulator